MRRKGGWSVLRRFGRARVADVPWIADAMEHDCKQDSQEFVVLRRGVAGSGANVFTDPPIVN